MKRLFTAFIACSLLFGCSKSYDIEEITPEIPATDYAIASVEVDATALSSRLYDAEGSWNWLADDTIAGMHLVKFDDNSTVSNAMTLKDNGKFGCDSFAYSSSNSNPYLFVYPASAVTLDTTTATSRFCTLDAVSAVQDGVYQPLLAGMHTSSLSELRSVELEAKTACIEVRVWADKNSENRGTRPVDKVAITTENPFTGYYTFTYNTATKKANFAVTPDYENFTISTEEGFEGYLAQFEVLPGTDKFEITLTDGTETKTITTAEKSLAANDRYIVNITWEYQPQLTISSVNSWYNDYYTLGNTATTLEPGYIYINGLEYLHGEPTVYLDGEVTTLLEGNKIAVTSSGEHTVYATIGQDDKMVTTEEHTVTVSMTAITLSLSGIDSWYNQYYTLGNTTTSLDAGCIYLNGYSYTGGTPIIFVNDVAAIEYDGKVYVGTGEYTVYAKLDLLETEKYTIKASKEKTIINLSGANSWYKQFSDKGESSLEGGYIYLEGYSYSGGSTPTVYVDDNPADLESGNKIKVASGEHTVYAAFDGVKTLEQSVTVTGIPSAEFKMHSNYNNCDGTVNKVNDYANTIKFDACTLNMAAEDAPYFETPVVMCSINGAAYSSLGAVTEQPAEYNNLAIGEYKAYIKIQPINSSYTLDFGSKKSVYVTGLPYSISGEGVSSLSGGWTNSNTGSSGGYLLLKDQDGSYIQSPTPLFYASSACTYTAKVSAWVYEYRGSLTSLTCKMVMTMTPSNASYTTTDMPDGVYKTKDDVSGACVERSFTPTLNASSAIKINVSRESKKGYSLITTGVNLKEIKVIYQ